MDGTYHARYVYRLNNTIFTSADSGALDDPASKFIVDRDAIREMDCEITYRLCLDRLQECSQHSQCPHPELTKLPTRVLDCLNPSHPRLFISNGTEMELYAALSYVWGEAQPSKTTMQNLEAYAAGIDINCIPQTICDAITVTRNLNLRYLWVDSFCIIQDSRPDKARELANMRNIFRNAYVTIAAASAKRVTEGFLQKRPVYRTPSTLPFYFPGESPGTMSLVAGTGPPAEAVDERAWCFEERLLSPRSLIFCSHTLRYECQSRAMNVDQTPRYLDGPIKNVRLPDRIFIGTTNNSHAEDKNDKYEWKSVLGKYTKRFLTKPRDRLVALSGIAEQFSLLWPESDYMAGLWRHHLPGSLLWVLRDTGAPLPRPFKYRAPSWSWASVDGEIIQDYATLGILCTVVSCEVTPVDLSNPFGEILSGNLRVRAILKKAVWDRAESELFEVGNNERGVSLSEHDDSDRGEIGWAVADAAEDGMESTSTVTVALVQSTANTVLGLVLAAAESHNGHIQTEIYRRVGRFSAPFCDRDSWLATPYQIIDII